jgi:hypothetical protein
MKKILLFLVLMVLVVSLSSCIPGNGQYTPNKQAGFFWGIWHGWLAPISLIIQWFVPRIQIYEPFNTGWWYDFGFYLGILGGFGGLSLSRKKIRVERI